MRIVIYQSLNGVFRQGNMVLYAICPNSNFSTTKLNIIKVKKLYYLSGRNILYGQAKY